MQKKLERFANNCLEYEDKNNEGCKKPVSCLICLKRHDCENIKDIVVLFEKLKPYEEALKFYADEDNYDGNFTADGVILPENVFVDAGEIARKALAGESK